MDRSNPTSPQPHSPRPGAAAYSPLASGDYSSNSSSTTTPSAWRRTHAKQSPSSSDTSYNPSEDGRPEGPSSSLLPYSSKDHPFDSNHQGGNSKPLRTVISIRILGIIILISLFSWFYLEALAGGDIEWVKDHLSMLGFNLVMSVLCFTTALTLIVLTPMSTVFAGCLFAGVALILFALRKWDEGETFEAHGAYNMLVFLVIAVPLNALIQSVLTCQRKMTPQRFRGVMTSSVVGITLLTTLLLLYYHSIWGTGANGAHLVHGDFSGTELCEWDGLNVPFADLLPNYIQNFWTGRLSCPAVSGIEAEWTYDGILTINCLNRGFKDSGEQPTYDVLPDTRTWTPEEKIMHTYNKKIVERTLRRTYTEPVLVNDKGVESIVAHCEPEVSKILIRVTRQEAVLDRVKAVAKARREQEETTTAMEQELVDKLHDDRTQPARRPNVMVMFMDAVSRRQFYRKLAKTSAVVANLDKTAQGGPQLHEFFRYHAVGFNTDANSRAIYSNNSNPNGRDTPNPPLWKDFYEAGYITARVEDNCEDWSTQYTGIATSQYFDHELQAPFCLPPYYALEGNPFSNFEGPYSIVARCLHGTNVHNYALDYMTQFRKAYPDQPWFLSGSFIEGHEGTGEVLLTADDDLARFMKGLEDDGTLDNTIVFMMADHGLHMGINFMFTPNGRIEHMNPYLSVILPPLVTKRYPSLAKGLNHNQQLLVTGFDIYATLKMLASGRMPENGDDDEIDGGSWRKGTLFDEEMDPARNCEQARVPDEYCKCRAA
ncbi:hypothetical protein EC968_000684 [Mortierella alpina]|nr:hypothetical protein EC968_000684 [Mortierella alpina]